MKGDGIKGALTAAAAGSEAIPLKDTRAALIEGSCRPGLRLTGLLGSALTDWHQIDTFISSARTLFTVTRRENLEDCIAQWHDANTQVVSVLLHVTTFCYTLSWFNARFNQNTQFFEQRVNLVRVKFLHHDCAR